MFYNGISVGSGGQVISSSLLWSTVFGDLNKYHFSSASPKLFIAGRRVLSLHPTSGRIQFASDSPQGTADVSKRGDESTNSSQVDGLVRGNPNDTAVANKSSRFSRRNIPRFSIPTIKHKGSIYSICKKESTEYQTPTLEPASSQLASRRKAACCTIASLTKYGLFQQSQQSLLITREVWL